MYASWSFPVTFALILGAIAIAVVWFLRYDAPADSKLRRPRFLFWTHVLIIATAAMVCGATWFANVSFKVPGGNDGGAANNVLFLDSVSEE